VARHLRGFGLHPVLITRTGNDALRDELFAEMARLDMDTSGIQCDPLHPTGQVKVHIENGDHTFEILSQQAYDHIHPGVTHMITMAVKPDIVYFGTLAQRNIDSRLALDNLLNDGKSPRFLDINLRSPWYDKHTIRRSLLRADIVKMNSHELAIISNLLRLPGVSDDERVINLINRFNLDSVLVSCGVVGAWLMNSKQEIFSAPGHPIGKRLVDTVGAGDGFAAIHILGILLGWPTKLMLERGNQFAASLCEISGAAPASTDFYEPFRSDWNV